MQDALPGLSAYHQTFGNPVAFADPLGLWPEPGLNRHIGESAGEQWMREHGMGAGYTNPVFQQQPAQDQFSSNLNSFVGGLPFGTRAQLTPFGNGQFYYYTYQGRAYRSNYDNILGQLSVTGHGELRLTDASYQYGNTFGERASNFSFWWDWVTDNGAFADDPNIIKMDIGDNPVSWLISGGGMLAAAKGLGAAKGASFGQRLFLSGKFGVTSTRFGNSGITGVSGSLNKAGGFFKIGWSGTKANGGGQIFRIGIGRNGNKSVFHLDIPGAFLPNSFVGPSMQLKQSIYNAGRYTYGVGF